MAISCGSSCRYFPGYKRPVAGKPLYPYALSGTSDQDSQRRVSVARCKLRAYQHDRSDMPRYLPAGSPTQYVPNNYDTVHRLVGTLPFDVSRQSGIRTDRGRIIANTSRSMTVAENKRYIRDSFERVFWVCWERGTDVWHSGTGWGHRGIAAHSNAFCRVCVPEPPHESLSAKIATAPSLH